MKEFEPEILARIRNDVGVKELNKYGCKFEPWSELGKSEKEMQIEFINKTIKVLSEEGWKIVRI